jgi:hypothetical protein
MSTISVPRVAPNPSTLAVASVAGVGVELEGVPEVGSVGGGIGIEGEAERVILTVKGVHLLDLSGTLNEVLFEVVYLVCHALK